jgi:hypothetical protein
MKALATHGELYIAAGIPDLFEGCVVTIKKYRTPLVC